MAAKLKAGKKTPAKKTAKATTPTRNPAVRKARAVHATAGKKSKPEKTTRAAAPTRSQSGAAKGVKAPAVSSPKNDWRIVNIVVDHAQVYGLSSDGRIYRWNTRSALWVLHKDGLTA